MQNAFWQKAEENLKSAQLLFENGFYNTSANRAYYAAFHSAIVALSKFGFKNPDNPHKWVQATFSGELIQRRKLYTADMKSSLLEMLSLREQADYKTDSISKKLAKEQLRKAQTFLEEIRDKGDNT
jgi:uncharacterized protein (UPF0332 family)